MGFDLPRVHYNGANHRREWSILRHRWREVKRQRNRTLKYLYINTYDLYIDLIGLYLWCLTSASLVPFRVRLGDCVVVVATVVSTPTHEDVWISRIHFSLLEIPSGSTGPVGSLGRCRRYAVLMASVWRKGAKSWKISLCSWKRASAGKTEREKSQLLHHISVPPKSFFKSFRGSNLYTALPIRTIAWRAATVMGKGEESWESNRRVVAVGPRRVWRMEDVGKVGSEMNKQNVSVGIERIA